MSSHILHNGIPLSSYGRNKRPSAPEFHRQPCETYPIKFKLYPHQPDQVSSALIKYIRQLSAMELYSNPKKLQVQGLEKWYALDMMNYQTPETEGFLQACFESFDDLFYLRAPEKVPQSQFRRLLWRRRHFRYLRFAPLLVLGLVFHRV